MSEHRTATLTHHRNGSVTIAGLRSSDLRLIANAVSEGSFQAGDHGGDVSRALLRLSDLLRTPAMFPDDHVPVWFKVGGSDAATLYEEE